MSSQSAAVISNYEKPGLLPDNRNRRLRPVVTMRLVSFLEHRGAFCIAAPLVGTLGCSFRQESTRMLYADQSLSSHTAGCLLTTSR